MLRPMALHASCTSRCKVYVSMKMKQSFQYIILFATLVALTSFAFKEGEKIRFHEINITASSIELIKWNIKDTSNTAFVQETVDRKGRTKELRFYNEKHQLAYTGSGFYGGPIIRYDYADGKIIETFFSEENEIANDFSTSEAPYRFIYHLNKNNQIEKIEAKYKIDFDWTEESFNETIKHLELYKQHTSDITDLQQVFGYSYASAKLNGINLKLKK